jgi:Holliday junction resolvase RusA-like endonuclease
MLKSETMFIKAVPKPRQTRSDKWKVRPCVARYRAFADELRLKFGKVPEGVVAFHAQFWIAMPKSWSKKKKQDMGGKAHRQCPDWDNLVKSCQDALFAEDSGISAGSGEKFWAEEDRIRIVLF